jgi:hypothetical protein
MATGRARRDGSFNDVDRKIFALFMIIDENQSHYLQHNIDTYVIPNQSRNWKWFPKMNAATPISLWATASRW